MIRYGEPACIIGIVWKDQNLPTALPQPRLRRAVMHREQHDFPSAVVSERYRPPADRSPHAPWRSQQPRRCRCHRALHILYRPPRWVERLPHEPHVFETQPAVLADEKRRKVGDREALIGEFRIQGASTGTRHACSLLPGKCQTNRNRPTTMIGLSKGIVSSLSTLSARILPANALTSDVVVDLVYQDATARSDCTRRIILQLPSAPMFFTFPDGRGRPEFA
jgi:hypothetical protein